MPYLPETNELLLDDEERSWISDHPDQWAALMEHAFKYPEAAASTLANDLRGKLAHYRSRWFVPAAQQRSPVILINNVSYRALLVECRWNPHTKTYVPCSVCGIPPRCRIARVLGDAHILDVHFADSKAEAGSERNRRIVQLGNYWKPQAGSL